MKEGRCGDRGPGKGKCAGRPNTYALGALRVAGEGCRGWAAAHGFGLFQGSAYDVARGRSSWGRASTQEENSAPPGLLPRVDGVSRKLDPGALKRGNRRKGGVWLALSTALMARGGGRHHFGPVREFCACVCERVRRINDHCAR